MLPDELPDSMVSIPLAAGVVGPRGGASVRGGVVDRDWAACATAQRDGEGEYRAGPLLLLAHR